MGEIGNRANWDKVIGRVRQGSAKRDEWARGRLPAGLRAPGRHKTAARTSLEIDNTKPQTYFSLFV